MKRTALQGLVTAFCATVLASADGCGRRDAAPPRPAEGPKETRAMRHEIVKTDEEWRAQLTPQQYMVTRQKATEPAFTGEYYQTKTKGTYRCVGCGQELFLSDTKYDSGCGWPSFWTPADGNRVEESVDRSHDMVRTEITCSRCGSHLGHVFDDGPKPTGLRYCINSAALKLEEAGKPGQSPPGADPNRGG